jgi:hypothetical protein
MDGLVTLQDATGWFPVLVVASLDEQRSLLVVNDDASDAD